MKVVLSFSPMARLDLLFSLLLLLIIMGLISRIRKSARTLWTKSTSATSLEGQVIIVANLSHSLLRETLKQLVWRSAAHVVLAVADLEDGYEAKAWVELETRKHNIWSASQGLEARGVDDAGRLITTVEVQLLASSTEDGVRSFAEAIELQLDRVDSVIVGEGIEKQCEPSTTANERSALLANMDKDLEKAALPKSHHVDQLATTVKLLLPKLRHSVILTGQQSKIVVVVHSKKAFVWWSRMQLDEITNGDTEPAGSTKSASITGSFAPASPHVSTIRTDSLIQSTQQCGLWHWFRESAEQAGKRIVGVLSI